MGIPIRVENDDGVGRLQIQSQTSGSGREDEDEILGLLGVENLRKETRGQQNGCFTARGFYSC